YLPYLVGLSPNATDVKHAITHDRFGGLLWTVIAALLLLGVAAAEQLSLAALAAVLATCLLGPLHVLATSTITNDASGVAAGALGMGVGSGIGFVGWLELQNMRAKVPSKTVIFALLNWTQQAHFQTREIFYGLRQQATVLTPSHPNAPIHVFWDIAMIGVLLA